jgi:hypothetical protein
LPWPVRDGDRRAPTQRTIPADGDHHLPAPLGTDFDRSTSLLRQAVHLRHPYLGISDRGQPRGGVPEAELLAGCPQLETEDIRAALAFAAEMTRERITPIPVEAGSP